MQNNQGLLRLESDFAVEHLEKIARHATEAQCDTIITALVNKLENSRSEQEARTFVALWNLCHMSRSHEVISSSMH